MPSPIHTTEDLYDRWNKLEQFMDWLDDPTPEKTGAIINEWGVGWAFGTAAGLYFKSPFIGLVAGYGASVMYQAPPEANRKVGQAVFDLNDWIDEQLEGAFDDPLFSPLVIDLDNDGRIELTPLEGSNAFFDLDGTGFAQQTGWVQPDDGLLAIDVNGDGVINDISELFGNPTTDGFIELTALDSNGDGFINNLDAQFSDLLIWQDADGDGYSDAGELVSAASAGVNFIDLDYAEVVRVNEGHAISSTSSITINGLAHEIADVPTAANDNQPMRQGIAA